MVKKGMGNNQTNANRPSPAALPLNGNFIPSPCGIDDMVGNLGRLDLIVLCLLILL